MSVFPNIPNNDNVNFEIILHSTGTGPDHQRLDRILALKKLPWSFNLVEQHELANFPGGDDGQPVMQIGRCFFVGSFVSIIALEQLKTAPTFFPNGNCGMPLALAWWSSEFFRVIRNNQDEGLFKKYCTIISRQIIDGRHFLQGSLPGLADIHSYAPLWALKEYGRDMTILESDALLAPWYQRVANMGEYRPKKINLDGNNLLGNQPPLEANFPNCDAIADKETLNWKDQGTLFLWRSPFASKIG